MTRARTSLTLALASASMVLLLGSVPVMAQTGATTGDPAVDSAPAAPTKKPRLKFRDANGSCTCTCAKGGLTEKDIERAEEKRRTHNEP